MLKNATIMNDLFNFRTRNKQIIHFRFTKDYLDHFHYGPSVSILIATSWLISSRGWVKIICTNIFNCSASNTHSTRLGHAKKLFIRKFPLKWGIVRFCRSYITRDMGQNVISRFYEFFKNLRKKFVSKNQTDIFSSGV